MDDLSNDEELRLGCEVALIKAVSFLELLQSTFVISYSSHDKSPNDPIVGILRIILYSLFDLLDCCWNVSLLEQRKSPHSVVSEEVLIVLLTLFAYFLSFASKAMNVKHVGQSHIGVSMARVYVDAFLEGFLCLHDGLPFEVNQAQVVLELSIVWIQLFCFKIDLDCSFVLLLLEQGYSHVEETLERIATSFLKEFSCKLLHIVPLKPVQIVQALLLEFSFHFVSHDSRHVTT